MRIMRTGIIAIALMLGASLVAEAQRIDSTSLAQLRPQRFVRIETPVLGRIQGTVTQHSATELLLADGGDHRVPVEDIQRAWVRGRHTKTGAIIGGILGTGGGLFLGLLIDAVCEGDCRGSAATVTVLGLGAGAGLGALVGSLFPSWKELH